MKPLILDYAIKRVCNIPIPFEYDYKEAINTIKINGQKRYFIDSDSTNPCLLSKTRVEMERDDEDNNSILELMSKTLCDREQDD